MPETETSKPAGTTGDRSDILGSFSFAGNLQPGLLFVGSVLSHHPVIHLGQALESGRHSPSSFCEYCRVSLAMSRLM